MSIESESRRGLMERARTQRRRVLVVDDSPTFRHAVMQELRKDGYELIAACSAEDALPLLQSQEVDCILMDVVLPQMDGITAARLIRGYPKLANVPMLLFTELFESRRMAQALAAGVDAFCPKEGDLGLLRAQVSNLLCRAQVRNLLRPSAMERSFSSQSMPEPKPRAGATGLFNRVVALSGLPSAIAATTIARACRRAHVEPEHLDVGMLAQALPAIRDALRIFLSEPETRRYLADIQGLTRTAQPEAAVSSH